MSGRQKNLLKEDLTTRADIDTYRRDKEKTGLPTTGVTHRNHPKENVKGFHYGDLDVIYGPRQNLTHSI